MTTKTIDELMALALHMVGEAADEDERRFDVAKAALRSALEQFIESAGADSERLDFILAEEAFVVWAMRDGSIRQCQLLTQDEDERYWVLSGAFRFFNTEREAIDAAIAKPEMAEYA